MFFVRFPLSSGLAGGLMGLDGKLEADGGWGIQGVLVEGVEDRG